MKITLEIKEDELLTMAEVGLSKITGKHKMHAEHTNPAYVVFM